MKDRMKQERIDTFIAKSTDMHIGAYDYSLVNDTYTTSGHPVVVICPQHGQFSVIPTNHARGYNKCPGCVPPNRKPRKAKYDSDDVIAKFRAIHGELYDYTQFKYSTMHTKSTIICPNHGTFNQSPADHIYRKAGCPECSGNVIVTHDAFVERARQVHGDLYEYVSTDTFNYDGAVDVICPTHGKFTVNHAYNHTHNKSGCVQCSRDRHVGGFVSASLDGDKLNSACQLYVLRIYDDNEEFYKVGITTVGLTSRCAAIPYNYSVVEVHDMTLGSAYLIEQAVIVMNQDIRYKPVRHFAGHTECFRAPPIIAADTSHPDGISLIPETNAGAYSFMKNVVKRFPTTKFFFRQELMTKLDIVLDIVSPVRERVFARTTTVVELDGPTYRSFVDDNHLQGADTHSTARLALVDGDGQLLQVMSFGKPRYVSTHNYELIRLCSLRNHVVIGGASKLMTYFIRNYNPSSIISYCDARLSTGNVYKKLGMTQTRTSAPKYYYLDTGGMNLLGRQQFQKHKLERRLPVYDSSQSERVNMESNGYRRVYDAGCYVFEWIA